MGSIWEKTSECPGFSHQEGDFKTDVLIIGGGITGILCAHMLKQAGVRYALVEAGEICGGTTKNTTAKLTVQHGLFCDRAIKTFGEEKTRAYLEANFRALEKYREMSENIDCDFEEKDAFVYSVDDREKIEKEVRAFEKLGYSAKFENELPLPFSAAGAVKLEAQAQFDPLKFAFAAAKELDIFEHTKVLEFFPGGVRTDKGSIEAEKIIVATHFPILNKHGAYFLKLYQHRSYVTAFKGASNVGGMYIDENKKGFSFRNYKDLLFVGGGSHRTGKKGGGWTQISGFAKTFFPNAREVCRWAAQDCMSLDDMPYIGRYSKRVPELFVASGFNKWGMTSSMAAAMILCDMVQEKENEYARVFSPSRSMLRPQLALNAAHAVLGLLTPMAPRCPHMGCALKYNEWEHSWDCSCHGSRFEENGELIDNPATKDKSSLKNKRRSGI